ncbi:MAG: NAD(P)/FAD-dependent oxidoreductase [Flavobacteriales bacterium]
MNIPDHQFPRIVIVGCGFGGLELAKKLRNQSFQVVLVDAHNYHTFQPLLYQVATSGLEPDSIAYPIRKIIKNYKNFFFRWAKVESVDTQTNTVHSNIGSLQYDHLVLATGSTTNFFGNQAIAKNAMEMKSIPQSLDIRSLLLQHLEEALLTNDLEQREALMNVVIVGGGPTGVELAGAISELRKHILPNDYPDLDVRRMRIHLVEAAPRVLASMSEEASAKSLEFLKSMDIEVWLNTAVETYDGNIVKAGDHKFLSRTMIWAAGVKGAPVSGIPAESITRGNRISVDEFNRVQPFKNVYAIGDVAQVQSKDTPNGHPMLAQVAMQQGKNLALNLIRWSKNQEAKTFVYKDLGSMATIGRNRAVVDLPSFKSQGFFAWFVWMGVHVIQLIGFRNKMLVLINWVYNYFKYARDIRLIIRPFKKPTSDTQQPS